MGVIWTSKTRTRQPQTPVGINWSNPISRGLVLAINGNEPSQNIAKNAIVTAKNGMGTRVGSGGIGLAQPSTSATGIRVDSSRLLAGSGGNFTGMTVVIVANPPNAGGWLMGLCLSAQTGTEWYVGWGTQLSGSSSAGTFSINTWAGTGVDVFGVCDGRDHVFAATFPEGAGTTASAYVDGVKTTGSVANSLPNTNSAAYVGGYWANGYAINGMSQYLTLGFNRELSAGEVVSLSKNPWQLFAPEKRPLFFSTGGGANTTGTLAVTLDAATLTGVGGVARSGTLATTLDATTLAGVGNVTRSGTLAVTLDAATLSGTGAVTTSGTLAVTLGDVTLAGVGSVAVGTNRDGALAVTLDSATLAGTGAVTRSGTLAVTLDAATLAGVGTAGQAVTGTLGVTLGNVTLAGIGAIPAAPSAGGGKTFGSNKKKKKQRKAIESEEWLKAEETAKQLLQDRFTKTTPEAKLEALASHIESLQPVIDALKALATEGVQEPVQETRTEELTEHQQVLTKFDALITKMASIEELLIIMMAQ